MFNQHGSPKTELKEQNIHGQREKTLTIGLAIICIIAIFTTGWLLHDLWSQYPWGLGRSWFPAFNDNYAPGGYELWVVLLFVAVFNPLLGKIAPKFKLTPKQLVILNTATLWGGMMVRTFIMQGGVLFGMTYHAMSSTKQQLLMSYSDTLLDFAFIKNEEVILGWLRGEGTMPWGAWLGPVIVHGLFFIVFQFVVICLTTLVRKRWTEAEHLTYPIATIKMAWIEGKSNISQEPGSLWRNKLCWLGIFIGFLLTGPTAINGFYPGFPEMNLGKYLETILEKALLSNPTMHAAFYQYVQLIPIAMSAMWFTDTKILFSIWVNSILRGLTFVPLINSHMLGLTNSWMSVFEISRRAITLGSWVAIALAYLWFSRRDIIMILKWALGKGNKESLDESDNLVSYKTAVWGGLIGFIFLMAWCMVVFRLSFVWAFSILFLLFAMGFALARMRCEAGVPWMSGPSFDLSVQLRNLLGPARIGVSNSPVAAFDLLWWDRQTMGLTASSLEHAVMSKEVGLKPRELMKIMLASLVIGVLVWYASIIPSYYTSPVASRSRMIAYSNNWQKLIVDADMGRTDVNRWQFFWAIFGAVGFAILSWLNNIFMWWPLHPLGFSIGWGNVGMWLAPMSLIVWIVKATVMRYGGLGLYRRLTPIVFGMGIGQILGGGVGFFLALIHL